MRVLLSSCLIVRNCKKKFIDMTLGKSVRNTSSSSTIKGLPVPQLNETLDRYLKSVKPFLNETELKETVDTVRKFKDQGGQRLQKLLEERAKKTVNWLEEWWLNTAYLEYRDPVVVFSSPGLVWQTQCGFTSEDERLQCTAHLISAALDFNQLLRCRSIPQENSGSDMLDMGQYYKVFGTTRIPLAKRDHLLLQSSQHPSTNILVMANNNIFSLEVYPDNHSDHHLDAGAIYHMLTEVVKQSSEPGKPIGLLTSDNRDNWARAYAILCHSKKNLDILTIINQALFVVCLDRPLPEALQFRNVESKTSKLLVHGGGYCNGNAANRWFDKTIQFVIGAGSDGIGISYEHSPAEGGPIGVLSDFIHDKMQQQKPVRVNKKHPKPIKLEFEADCEEIDKAIETAGKNIDKLSNDLDLFGYKFSDFGKNQIKQLKVSPDSFIQVAIQLAFYKVHKCVAAQYESATLRKFQGGRTEVIRTCSEEVANFCKSHEQPSAHVAGLLRSAIDAHKNYANDAIAFKGVDRHLLGLKLIAKEHELPLPALFCDASYLRSTYFRLSTSNVPSLMDAFMIYGPLVQDGYGCCYNPRADNINFGLSAWSSNPDTDLDKFQTALRDALNEMNTILMKHPQAKL